jgi:4-amino-4-deoxy-L-arabinose transferase-like glycosyltransferase
VVTTVQEISVDDARDSRPEAGPRPRTGVRTARRERGRVTAAIAAIWPALLPALVALGLCGYQLTLSHALAGIHGYTGYGYDDGVYLGTAIRLVHGVLPYRDYAFVHPPGIALLMTPAALVGRFAGTRDAMAVARLLTVLVVGINAALAAWVVRSRGRGAMLVAGLALACFPLARIADHTVMLEPYLVFFCLAGACVMFDRDGALAGSRRLLVAGALFGFAGAIKLFAIFPVVAALCCCLPLVRRLRTYVVGLALGFGVVVLPFFVLAPRAMFHDVIVSQLGRGASGRGNLPFPWRLVLMFGIGGLQSVQTRGSIADWVAAGLVVLVVAGFFAAGRRWSRVEWFLFGATAVTVTAMLSSAQFFEQYAYFAFPFGAMLLATSVGRIGEFATRASPRLQGRSADALRLAGAVALPAVLVVGALSLIPSDVNAERALLAGAADPGSLVAQAIPRGACVVTDDPMILVNANRVVAAQPGCPKTVDAYGMWLTDNNQTPPPAEPPFPAAFTAKWRGWFERADYVALSVQLTNYIPWTTELVAWFNVNYTLELTLPRTYVYRRVGEQYG